jgi:hypothetical protein
MKIKNNYSKKKIFTFSLYAVFIIQLSSFVYAANTIKQTINIKAGWNSIFLEVQPVDSNPDILFKNTPINLVLTYFPKNSSVQFIESPDEIKWKQEGWHRWMPSDKPESVINNLYSINDNQAYIIFSTHNYTLEINGVSTIRKHKWQPDSFNLIGFYVDPIAPPTFTQYFENSKAHSELKIYHLNNNNWTKIENPDAYNIESGKAYWVYCNGNSNYTGPIEVILPGTFDYLNYIDSNTELAFEIINHTSNPLSFTIQPVVNESGEDMVPLSIVSYTLKKTKIIEPFISFTPTDALEPGQKLIFRLAVRRNDIIKDEVTSVLKLIDDLGNRFYIPVFAEKINKDDQN